MSPARARHARARNSFGRGGKAAVDRVVATAPPWLSHLVAMASTWMRRSTAMLKP